MKTGVVVGMRVAFIDVTDRKHIEDAAYQNATELRALFQAFPDLFLRVDRERPCAGCASRAKFRLVAERGKFWGRKSAG